MHTLPHIDELIRRAELRLEQYLIARSLMAHDRAAAQTVELQVNASLAMLAYLRSVGERLTPEEPAKRLH